MSFYGDETTGQLLYGDSLDARSFAGCPVKVDGSGVTDPAAISSLRERRDRAAAAGDFRGALLLSDLLYVVEPRPPMTVAECAPETVVGKTAFFMKNG
jgi:hypothetical protein